MDFYGEPHKAFLLFTVMQVDGGNRVYDGVNLSSYHHHHHPTAFFQNPTVPSCLPLFFSTLPRELSPKHKGGNGRGEEEGGASTQ